MARTVRDAKLETRAARDRLKAGEAIYWRTLVPGELHLGYRRRRAGLPGVWIARRFVGKTADRSSGYVKRVLGTADDYAEANGATVLSFADAQREAIAKSPEGRVSPRPVPTVREAMEDYIAFLRAERKSGDDAQQRAQVHILPAIGDVRLNELTLKRLEDWRADLVGQPARLRTGRDARTGEVKKQRYRPAPQTEDQRRARRATVNRTVTILKAALNRARRHHPEVRDDSWRMLKPFEKVGAQRPGHLSVAEAQRLINASDAASGFRNLVQAALLTGCRYGELSRLRVGDYARGRITVRESKSGKPRDVRLTEEGVAFFSALCAGSPADQVLFRRADEGAWQKSHQARPMRAACAAAKIVPAVGFHQLRHTWASLSVMSGMPLMLVAECLGHADTRMVEKHYGHLTEDYRDHMIREHAPRFGITPAASVASLDERREART